MKDAGRVILIFVKYPQPGTVKTRIAATVGDVRAAEIYRELVARVWAALPRDTPVTVCFEPSHRRAEVEAWLPGAARYEAQAAGDIGVRLQCAVASAFSRGCETVAVVGSDCVDITPEVFAEVWDKLRTHDLVLGPAHDGGYYLLGLNAPNPALFENIRWSTEHTLADTLARAHDHRTHLLKPLADIDTHADWEKICSS